MSTTILNDFRILDFTRVLAGPFATRLLADFGAEVIKVQTIKTSNGAETNNTGYFNSWNRNKRSITLDMSHPEAIDIALRLIAKCDVVIENFSPRVMSNWNFEYDRLKEVKPDIIMLSMSGMGQTGPWRDFVAFGPTVQALSGLTYLTSFSEDAPCGLGFAYADHIAGLYGALSVLAALEHRDRTGEGQYIDLSQYEAICTMLGPVLLNETLNHNKNLQHPNGNYPDYIQAAPYGCYKCIGNDRWCVIAIYDESEWSAFCNATGHQEWMKDVRFSDHEKRKKNSAQLDELVSDWSATHTAEEVVLLMQKAGISSEVVQNAHDLAHDPHLDARDYFIQLEHPNLGENTTEKTPIKFNSNANIDWKTAPLFGEDNRYVFMELLGLSESEFDLYIKKGVIG